MLERIDQHWQLSMKGHSPEAIAAMTGLGYATVKRDLRRGQELLVDRMEGSARDHIARLHLVLREAWRATGMHVPGARPARFLKEVRETEIVIAKLDGSWKPDQTLTAVQIDARRQELTIAYQPPEEQPAWLTAEFSANVERILAETKPGPGSGVDLVEAVEAPYPPALPAHVVEDRPERAVAPVEGRMPELVVEGQAVPADPDRASRPVIVTGRPQRYGGPAQPRTPVSRAGGSAWYDGRFDRE